MSNFSLVWALHMGRFHSLSLFPSDMELKTFPCVCWQLLAPWSYWGIISMKCPRRVSRSFSLACQIVFQADPACSFSLGWLWSSPIPLDIYLRFCCFRMQAFLFPGILSKCEVDREDDKTLLLNYLFSFCLIPCSFLVGGYSKTCYWWGAKLFTVSRLLNVHMARAHVQGQLCPWTSPFLSKSLLGWLSHFLSCWSHPWKGFEVWSVFDVFWPCQSLPGRREALSSLCKWVLKSVCLPSCCVPLLSLWCPSSMVPCMPHPVPGMQQVLITTGSVWKPAYKMLLELPLTHSILFPSSHPIFFPLRFTTANKLLPDVKEFQY